MAASSRPASNPSANRAGAGSMAARAVKRLFDVVVGTALLVLAAPVLALAAAAVWIDDGRPLFYAQRRVGRHGRSIDLRKFRSMRLHDAPMEELGQITPDHELVTRTGRWLRRLKIDELPQLVGVVQGDLSLVGPRPTVPEQVAEYSPIEARRLEVRPGLTGWAQINGNTAIPWSERIALDVWYVDHWSLGFDLAILAKTLEVVVRGERPNPVAIEEAVAYAERLGRGS